MAVGGIKEIRNKIDFSWKTTQDISKQFQSIIRVGITIST